MNRASEYRSRIVLRWLPVMLMVLPLAAGCHKGPARYKVSGKVTYAGQPISKGEVTFAPDTTKGNSGPGAIAPIESGTYTTPPETGIVGGPHVVTISGFDGVPVGDSSMGTAIFNQYRTTVDLPKDSDATQDFDVPKGGSAAPRRAVEGPA